MKTLIALLLNFVALSGVYAQSINLKENTQFEIESRMVNVRPDDYNEYETTFQFKALGKEGENTILECKLVRVRVFDRFNNGTTAVFNTDSIRNTKFASTLCFLYLPLLQKPLTVVISPKNVVLSVSGVVDAIDEAAAKWVLMKGLTDMMKQNSMSFPRVDINNLFFNLPEKELKYGYEWKGGDSLYYKVTAINGALLYIKSSTKPNDAKIADDPGSLIVFNEVTGLAEETHNESKQKVTTMVDGRKTLLPQFSVTRKLRTGANKYPLDTAWINMAVKTNWMYSLAFKTNAEFDSAKVFTYFKAHDATLEGDPTYMINKLNLVQQVMKDDYKLYNNLLVHTPTRYLKDEPTHLYNKMGDMLATSPDSAYEVVRYMYKGPEFRGWVQENYAQNFLNMDDRDILNDPDFKKYVKEKGLTQDSVQRWLKEQTERHDKAQINSVELLNRMQKDKDPLMKQQTEALYLWVNAKQSKDPTLLVKTSNKLMQMNDLYNHTGNGSRYSLLIYKELLKAKKQSEADELLQKTIITLERYTADTMNTARRADQNLLVYAYYLKYQQAKLTDSVKALQYLGKAAQYSPKNNNEKAYTSFYDRAFLNSKESYRDEFIAKLFNSGNDEEALKVFVDNINADPGNLGEMQKVYEEHFPGKDFKKFFVENIVSAWKTAPAFTVKGIDGKDRSLADFKNKWLVIDFWGTWCPPCRHEMPALNTYNQELKDGKHNGINLLSVVCRDNESNVKSFFANYKYDLPAAMASLTIEKDYGIDSYPSKIVISPDGRMLLLKYGDDWAGIVEKFSALGKVE